MSISSPPRASLRGRSLLQDPRYNRGTAFTDRERAALGLEGLLPSAVVTLDQQVKRSYEQYAGQPDDFARNRFMGALRDRNQVLYYRLLEEHLAEMLPVVYDPVVAQAIEHFSHVYQRPDGVYLSVDDVDDVETAFRNYGLGSDDVDLIVATDAEAILGIGDWGANGMAISVGKLAVYTAAAGIHPDRVIPVMLDVGTDNETLLNDPLYVGNRHSRVRDERYDALIAAYMQTASRLFPDALLHFEDFGPSNARRILTENRERARIFNDDMQGTGAVVMAGLLNALKVTGSAWRDQRVVIFGGGTAGIGIADQVRDRIVRDGLAADEATRQIWIVDLPGLLTDDMSDGLLDYQRSYARPVTEASSWTRTRAQVDPTTVTRWPEMAALRQARAATGIVALETVIAQVKPTILVGASTAHGAFTQQVVATMSAGTKRPIVFPISNPTEQIEGMPADIITWSEGQALIATGLPIPPFDYDGVRYWFGQSNNALLYPGLGLGVLVAGASRVTDGMLVAAAEAVAGQVDVSIPGASLLPAVENLRASSATTAIAVARAAAADGVATRSPDSWVQAVQDAMWQAVYPDLEVPQ